MFFDRCIVFKTVDNDVNDVGKREGDNLMKILGR